MQNKKVRILIMGGRFAPHFLGVVADPPELVEMIVSRDTSEQQIESARKALQAISGLQLSNPPLRIDAYDIQSARVACRKIASKYIGANITFDVTSAPKIPSFAAMDIAREMNQRLIYIDSNNGKIITLAPLTNETDVRIQIKLKDYLRCFGRRPELTFNLQKLSISEEIAVKAAEFLAYENEAALEALEVLRRSGQGKGKRTIPFEKTRPVSPSAFSVLQHICQLGLIKNLQQDEKGRVRYTIQNDHDFKFLEGAWLELFVYCQANAMIDENQQPFFNDVKMSVEIPSNGARKEIDVACMFRGQLLLSSCKTGIKAIQTKHLDELRAVSDLVGGDFTTRLFITSQLPPKKENGDQLKKYQIFLEQAKERKIVVVTGDMLCQIQQILKKEAINPTYSRI